MMLLLHTLIVMHCAHTSGACTAVLIKSLGSRGHDLLTISAVLAQELEPQLNKLRAAKARGARDLLVHLQQNHLPKFKDKRPEPAHDDIRGALRKAVVEYHPDKQLQYCKTWQFLSTEISKAVNEVWADYCSYSHMVMLSSRENFVTLYYTLFTYTDTDLQP